MHTKANTTDPDIEVEPPSGLLAPGSPGAIPDPAHHVAQSC